MKLKYFIPIAITLLIGFFYYTNKQPQKSSLGTATQITPIITTSTQTKTIGCTVHNALPDTMCTPGAIFPNVTRSQICKPGYAKSVRNVPVIEKQQVYEAYGITHHTSGEYEIDHLISLELGGSNEIDNLWPEAANPIPGFHEKDMFENFLHDEVCNGTIPLPEAQHEISTNWLQYWIAAGRP